jgi:hypothetical protein
MNRNRIAVSILALTIMIAASGRSAVAQPFNGGTANGQLTLHSPDVFLQGFNVNYPSSSYTVPGSTAVVTTGASITNTIMPTIAGASEEMNVSVSGNPLGNGYGISDQADDGLVPTPQQPPPNVDYLYYITGSFHITGHVAQGDSLQFEVSLTFNGTLDTLLSYSNTFGPGDFNVAEAANPIFLGDYYSNPGVYSRAFMSIFIDRSSDPGQEPTYIDVDPTVSVFVPAAAVPEPSSLVLLTLGFADQLLWRTSGPSSRRHRN